MTDFQTGIITLMRCAITGECAQLPDGFSIEEAETVEDDLLFKYRPE